MNTYQLNGQLVGVSDRYIYLEEIFKHTPRSFQLVRSQYLSCKSPITKRPKKADYKYDKSTKTAIQRIFTLCYAPEHYLITHGYNVF